ncbi:AsmA family protein [Galbibacter pacificus]|uniref:AsmA family protein n=1 Tax=Galbibacter pacificus TaxID=2996052 RepID=A0ABT6FT75_9FLAO|nr:AsmA-like C-terminal region-containing protein [Galbibacter pacificus]MDG3582426.1 AsmA-like C-terminal region-containing protein [Galbibacter pacificus]MDG3586456.1 AsmA family protein [Galbibacter pacificus]
MKKILKIVGIVLGILIVFLVAAPFLFEGKIIKIVKSTVNKNINADFDFTDADVSLITSFPNASVIVENLSIINKVPFEGDTLVYAKNANISLPFMQIFNKEGEPYSVNSFSIDGAVVNIYVDENGKANYDIAKETTNEAPAETPEKTDAKSSSNVSLNMQKYEITNSKIKYYDEQGKMYFELTDFNHFGKGDLSATKSELDTETSGLLSFEMDSVNYFSKNPIQLDALLGIDLAENKYTFLENKAIINQLELVFDGFVKVNENNQEVDITFKTPSSDFKNFLAVIPEEYSKNIQNVQTTGDFMVAGKVNGTIDDAHIPKFDVVIQSNNASFKYPDLPQAVNNITIDTKIANETGLMENTYVDINKLTFKIAQDVFSAQAHIKNITDNPLVNANLKGRINLANLSNAYPFSLDTPLKGILDANLSTAFDMNSIEKEQYQNTKNSGTLALKGFEYSSEEMKNPVQIANAEVTFNTSNVSLNAFEAKTGQTDLSAKGSIQNLLGYMFNKETLKGNFTLNSNTFAVNDFMMEETEAAPKDKEENKEKPASTAGAKEEELKIPSFLDATIAAKASTVIYDNLQLKNVSGTLIVRDETVMLKDLTSSLFGGNVAVNGSVSTKTETPTFNMDLGIKSFDISQSFQGMDMLQAITPIAQALKGKLNSNLSLKGNLNSDFTPNLMSVSGNALAEALVSGFDPEKGKMLSALSNNLDFLNFKEGETKDVKTSLTFDNGKVNVKPFHIKYKDIDIEVAGSHGFDKSIDYNATFNVPAKYFGKDVNNLLAKLNDPDAKNITVPVKANIGGTYSSPSISTDVDKTASALTQKLIAMQKDKLINQGSDKIKDAISGLIGGGTAKDSTAATGSKTADSAKARKQEQVKNAANDLIKGLFGNKKKDTTNQK